MSNGIVGKDPVVDAHAKAPRSRSRVPFSNKIAGTYRFGEYQPHFVAEVENSDKFPLRSIHRVRSFNLKAPLMSDIQMKKDYFQVNMEAILPLNWDKIFTPPVTGDDVNAEQVNCVITSFPQKLADVISAFKMCQQFNDLDPDDPTTFAPALEAYLKLLVFAEYFLSSGSLFETLGVHIHSLFHSAVSDYISFDQLFDDALIKFNQILLDFPSADIFLNIPSLGLCKISPERYLVNTNGQNPNERLISFGWFLDYIRDDFNWSLFISNPEDIIDVANITAIQDICNQISIVTINNEFPVWPLNLKRPLAYQLACRHFYSNDKIDYVYSAELYRQLMYDVFKRFGDSMSVSSTYYDDVFIYNGLQYRYDFLSGHNFAIAFGFAATLTEISDLSLFGDICRLAFGFNRSLRYLDYFTGAKASPLAVGDINAPVVAGQVNAIDTTRSIQYQRFFNFVNRVGRKFEEYTSKMNGTYVKPDFHNPLFLGHTQDVIYGSETENTTINPSAANQPAQSTISNLRSNASRFAFEMTFDREAVIIGITYFDIERFYSNVIERQNFHVDRYDMFNKFLQYIGDQPISRAELVCCDDFDTPFGYALRHMEYKTRVNQTFGGFSVNQLPGFEFIADQSADLILQRSISPDYIRSRPSELDPFFLSLTGYSRGTYFHFIIENNNVCEPVRPMVYAPEIL